MPFGDLVEAARSYPDLFDSLWWHAENPAGRPDWLQGGETMQEARDRMKRERAAAKAKSV